MKGVKGSETKRLIREAAYKQFLTKDYNTVPLKEIEKSLNLSRGCMSYHYPSKQELFIDVIDFYIFHKQDAKNKFKDMFLYQEESFHYRFSMQKYNPHSMAL